ncbi:MAG TPA: S8 family serine peptidase [Bacteriovoracaceae bacterium]|nr:S8 family serine peptidase [Bacteriovoracaceae bacterium]
MREQFKILVLASVFAANLAQAQESNIIPGKYIVILKEQTDLGSRVGDLIKGKVSSLLTSHGIDLSQAKHIYSGALKGFAAKLSEQERKLLALDPRVQRIEADQVYSVSQSTNYCPVPATQPRQLLGWGPQRIGYGAGTGKVAWVVDTGIDLCHPDLNVDKVRSRSFIGTSANDDHGHGTHVAGIIAAKNNSIGIRGVASNALVVAVKVLGANGQSSMSSVIAGVDYVYSNIKAGEVVNLSLGGGASQAMDDAVKRVAAKGAWVVVAAGNDTQNAADYSPARANGSNIFTISAFRRGDAMAAFSNYGNPPVDYSLPGEDIYSTYKNGSYARMNGTSMAAPHMAGLLLLTNGALKSGGYVSGDPDGRPDPIAVR